MAPGLSLVPTDACLVWAVCVQGAKIALLDIDLRKSKMAMGVQVVVTDPKKLEDIRQREADITKERIQLLLNAVRTSGSRTRPPPFGHATASAQASHPTSVRGARLREARRRGDDADAPLWRRPDRLRVRPAAPVRGAKVRTEPINHAA